MMGLIYADVVVHGLEDTELYAYEISDEAFQAPHVYLLSITVTRMNGEQRAAYQALRDQKKFDDAFDYAVSTDKFTADAWEVYDHMKSTEQWLEVVDKIEKELEKEQLKPTAKQPADFEAYRKFVRYISLRSDAMAAKMLKVAAENPGALLALAGLGADHIERIVELLARAGVSVVVIDVLPVTKSEARLLSDEQYKRKNQARSVAPAGHLGALLDRGRKPPPVADQEWYKQGV